MAEDLWGRGIAPEAARAVMAYCFETLNWSVIRASTDVANAASIRVLEKLRFRQIDRRTISGLATMFFERER